MDVSSLCVAIEMICQKAASKVRQLHRRMRVVALVDDVFRFHIQVVNVILMQSL